MSPVHKTISALLLVAASSFGASGAFPQDTDAADREIAEAVAVAGLTRNWSANFYGLQVDFQTFKKELGGK